MEKPALYVIDEAENYIISNLSVDDLFLVVCYFQIGKYYFIINIFMNIFHNLLKELLRCIDSFMLTIFDIGKVRQK